MTKIYKGYDFEVDAVGEVLLAMFNWLLEKHPSGIYLYRPVKKQDGSAYAMKFHRVLAGLTVLEHGVVVDNDPKLLVDHIDGNTRNNQLSNLRICTKQQNTWHHIHLSRRNTSGCTGVSLTRTHKKWEASIAVNRKKIHLGNFENYQDAVDCYMREAPKYHGEYCSEFPIRVGDTITYAKLRNGE